MSGYCNQLISISDLEGCLHTSSSEQKQHVILCAEQTFTAIKEYLKKDTKNHIAFLGDYFDHGPHMLKSIKGIVECRTEYPNQVYIILGNRDINKMRIAVEKDINYVTDRPDVTAIWSTWASAFATFKIESDNNSLERTKHLLAKTYNAPYLLNNISIELDIQEKEALELFTSIFLKDDTQTTYIGLKKDFVDNCKKLFEYGKIMAKVSVGDKNVLLSHGGSFSGRIFTTENIELIDGIKNIEAGKDKLPEGFKQRTNYYEKMEACRIIIDVQHIDTMQFDNIDKVINSYNSFYTNVLNYLKSIDLKNVDTIRTNYSYHMLQATPLSKSGSPVSNCVLNGFCNSSEQIKVIPKFLEGYLNKNKIHIISHGHIPFCGTVPLIYKNGDIIYVSNDTSNGNRPSYLEHDVKLQNVPLSLITTTGVGICSLNDNGTINPPSTMQMQGSEYLIHAYKNSNSPNDPNFYRDFVTAYNYKDNNFPTHTHINTFFEPNTDKSLWFSPMKKSHSQQTANIAVYKPEFDPYRLDGGGKKSKKYRKSITCFKCGNSCCKCCTKSKKINRKSRKAKKSKKARKTMKNLNKHKRRNRTLNKNKSRYSK